MIGELNFGGLPTSSTELVRWHHKPHSPLNAITKSQQIGA
jgi:hypothetical protein